MQINSQISGTSKRNNTLDRATAGKSNEVRTQPLPPNPSSSPLSWPTRNIRKEISFQIVCIILNNASCLSETRIENLKAVVSKKELKQNRQLWD